MERVCGAKFERKEVTCGALLMTAKHLQAKPDSRAFSGRMLERRRVSKPAPIGSDRSRQFEISAVKSAFSLVFVGTSSLFEKMDLTRCGKACNIVRKFENVRVCLHRNIRTLGSASGAPSTEAYLSCLILQPISPTIRTCAR
jgi:hypothetical protein